MHQGGNGYHPALIQFADQVLRRHFYVFKKHLGKFGLARHLDERPGAYSRRLHIHDQVTQTFVLGRLEIGTHQQDAEVGHVPITGPDFLPVHHKMVILSHRPGLEGGHIGTGVRLAKPLTPDFLGAQDLGQVTGFLFRSANGQDGGANHIQTDHIRCGRGLSAGHLFIINRFLHQVSAPPTILLRPADTDPAGLE